MDFEYDFNPCEDCCEDCEYCDRDPDECARERAQEYAEALCEL